LQAACPKEAHRATNMICRCRSGSDRHGDSAHGFMPDIARFGSTNRDSGRQRNLGFST